MCNAKLSKCTSFESVLVCDTRLRVRVYRCVIHICTYAPLSIMARLISLLIIVSVIIIIIIIVMRKFRMMHFVQLHRCSLLERYAAMTLEHCMLWKFSRKLLWKVYFWNYIFSCCNSETFCPFVMEVIWISLKLNINFLSLIINQKYDTSTTVALEFIKDSKTRGNEHKLNENHCKYDLRKRFFTNKLFAIWNILPGYVLNVNSIDIFKNRLDKHWRTQDRRYHVWLWVWINRNWELQFRVMILNKSLYICLYIEDTVIEALSLWPSTTLTWLWPSSFMLSW